MLLPPGFISYLADVWFLAYAKYNICSRWPKSVILVSLAHRTYVHFVYLSFSHASWVIIAEMSYKAFSLLTLFCYHAIELQETPKQ